MGRYYHRPMKKLILALALLLPAAASAQVVVHFGWTAPPPVVEVSPGVQVVEDGNDEIFFTNGRYWVERGGVWYVARDYHERWRVANVQRVPVFVRNHHRGEYLHYRRVEHPRQAVRREEHREAEHHRETEHREIKREVKHEERREERHER
jgi:hypothetical protein